MVLINVPWADNKVPFIAPALLKGVAETHGYTVRTRDFNLDLQHHICGGDQALFESMQEYFEVVSPQDPHRQLAERLYEHIISELDKLDFRYLGISVFYIFSQKATWELCHKIRRERPHWRIVLGGKGLSVHSHLSLHPHITQEERKVYFSRLMTQRDLADHAIVGDAEDAIIDLLSGVYDGITVTDWAVPQRDNLEYPFADFDDYKLDQYQGLSGNPQLPIVSSKGCVRRCDFCDVPSQFKKFQSKTGVRMAEEVLYLSDKYKIYDFTMADSIANGNMRSLRQFAEVIAKHNETADNRITWNCNWIHRPIGQITDDTFDLLAKSGAKHFTVGAEHLSDPVLEAMNKKTTVEGLMHELNHFSRLGIQCTVNNILGHWSETADAFRTHVKNIIKLGPLFANGTITHLQLSLFHIMKNTPAVHNHHYSELEMLNDDFSLNWYTPKNPSLTLKPRLARMYAMYYLSYALNYPFKENPINITNYIHRAKETEKEIQELYDKYIDKESFESCDSLATIDHIDEFIEECLEQFKDCAVKIKLRSESVNGDPHIEVRSNGTPVFDGTLSPGLNEIDFHMDYINHNSIEMIFKNKGPTDTRVDPQGNIIADKKIEFESITIDGCEIVSEYNFYSRFTDYFIGDRKQEKTLYGLYANNSRLELKWRGPFWLHFQRSKDSRTWHAESNREKFKTALTEFKKYIDSLEF